jgi:hypothetical protein
MADEDSCQRSLGLDPVGGFIATLHQMVGHDQAAAFIGQAPGHSSQCLLCMYEDDPTDERRARVIRALAPSGDQEGQDQGRQPGGEQPPEAGRGDDAAS